VRTEFTLVRFGQDAEREDDFYKGFTPLNARDIADNVMYVTTRPQHVQVGDIVIYASKQSSEGVRARPQPSGGSCALRKKLGTRTIGECVWSFDRTRRP